MQDKRAVTYCRYSSDQQNEVSIEIQREACITFGRQSGLNFIGHYADFGESASKDIHKRIEFQKLIQDSAKGLFDIVCVYKFDRFSRRVNDFYKYVGILESNNVQLLSTIENNSDEAENLFCNTVHVALGQLFVGNLSRNVKNGLKKAAQATKFTGSRAPLLGYDVDPKTKKYVINPEKAETVKTIFSMFIDGHSYKDIARHLNGKGLTNGIGKPFKAFFHDTISNSRYAGLYVFRPNSKQRNGKRCWRKSRPQDEIRIPGGCPAIVDQETFELANKILNERKHGTHTPRKYILSGLIRCAECGAPMSGSLRRKHANQTVVLAYRCNSRRKRMSPCPTKELVMQRMDSWAIGWLRSNILRKGGAMVVLNKLRKLLDALANSKNDSAQAELSEIDSAIVNLVQALSSTSGGAHEVLTREIDRLSEKRDELAQKAYIEQRDFFPVPMNAEAVRQTINTYADMLDSGNPLKMREAAQLFIVGIKVNNEKIVMTLKLNAFLVGRYRHEVSFDITEDRNLIILGKSKL